MADSEDIRVPLCEKMESEDAEAGDLMHLVTDLMRQGDIHDYRGEYDKAIVSYDNAIKIDPNCAEAWFNKSITLNKLGKQSEATRCVAIALNLYKLTYSHL